MQYPNAASGSGKIFVGEILALIFSICSGLAVVLAAFAVASTNKATELINDAATTEDWSEAIDAAFDASTAAQGTLLGSGAIILIGAIVGLVGLILVMVGCGQAGKDEQSFKTALILYVCLIVLSVASSFLRTNPTVSAIISFIYNFGSLYAFFLIINGFRNLARNMGNSEVEQKGANTFRTVAVLVILTAVVSLISSLVGGTIGGILGILSIVCSLAYFIMFIGFVGKAKNMLNGVA